MPTFQAEIIVRGWTDGTQADADKNVSVPRCTKTITHVFTASSEEDAEIMLKWFLNHPATKYRFQYHTIKKVFLAKALSQKDEGTQIVSVDKGDKLVNARGIRVSFNRDKLYTEERRSVDAASGNYCVVFWGKHSVEISTSASPGDAMSYLVPIDSLIVLEEEGSTESPGWCSLAPRELMYIANKHTPVFHDPAVEAAVS